MIEPISTRHRFTPALHPLVRLDPFEWCVEKVLKCAEVVFGFILRVAYFQMGEHGWFAELVMRAHERLVSCDPRAASGFSAERLKASKALLEQFGGVESTVVPEDGGAEIKCMIMTPVGFWAQVTDLGGVVQEVDGKRVIVASDECDEEQFKELQSLLAKFYLLKGTLKDGRACIFLPQSEPGHKPVIVRCHSPGRSMYMDRRFIGLHLACGYPICIFDYRGTSESTGTPSEAGYYLDAEAVLQHAKGTFGCDYSTMWVSGMCAGTATAAHLMKKFGHQGLNFFGENGFSSLHDMGQQVPLIGRPGIYLSLSYVKDSGNQLVHQDGFNTARKFASMTTRTGRIVWVETEGDTFVDRGATHKIREVASKSGTFQSFTHLGADPKTAHTKPPTEYPVVWNWYVLHVT